MYSSCCNQTQVRKNDAHDEQQLQQFLVPAMMHERTRAAAAFLDIEQACGMIPTAS